MAIKRPRRQCAALPLTWRDDGSCLVLLVTSRETRRWVLPKGWRKRKVTAWEQAAREAYEEAGLIGQIGKHAIGRYRYDKQLRDGRSVPCRVDVFPLEVTGRLDDWPEKAEREAAWFAPAEAAASVDEPGLAEILRRLDGRTPEDSLRPTASRARVREPVG
jgi:8-oxo-dGTP pyrophosphatase MutT (NUDIX family)